MTQPARIVSVTEQPPGVHVAEFVSSDRRIVTGLEAGQAYLATYLSNDLMQIADRSNGPIVLNLGEVDWIDSGACTVLVRFWRTMRASGRTVVLCVTDPVREALSITGLIRLIPCFGNLNEAVEAARGANGMMGPLAVDFPDNYITSRTRFRDAAKRLGWSIQSHTVEGTGPNGEELAIDAAISPAQAAEHVLVVSSGLHGVEGPFGAAVQIAVMDAWAQGAPANVRYVFLHALNPHAYAWGRRVDAVNVDPNRNFLLTGQEFLGSPDGYKSFDALLNPRSPPARFDGFILRSWLAILRHGMPELKQALVSGQYDYPQGIFFGGHGPTATHLALRERLREWVGPAGIAVHLDFHTGLGKWGSCKLLLDAPVTSEQRSRLDQWFGRDAYEEDDPRGVAYLPRGSFGPWCVAQRAAVDYTYLVAEFGTYGIVHMLTGIRAENQAHHWGRPGQANFERAKAGLRERFCPSSLKWRTKALNGGLELVHRAANGLAAI